MSGRSDECRLGQKCVVIKCAAIKTDTSSPLSTQIMLQGRNAILRFCTGRRGHVGAADRANSDAGETTNCSLRTLHLGSYVTIRATEQKSTNTK